MRARAIPTRNTCAAVGFADALAFCFLSFAARTNELELLKRENERLKQEKLRLQQRVDELSGELKKLKPDS